MRSFFYFKGLILKVKGTPEGIPLSTGFRARGFRQFFDILGIIIFLRFLDFGRFGMDNLFDLKLNINQIAELVGMHRQTVSQRVAGLTPAIGSNSKLKLYALSDLIKIGLAEKMTADVDSLSPVERRAFWQAENERLKYERDTGELVPSFEVAQEMGFLAKAVVQSLDTLPDILERDCGLTPSQLTRVIQVIDDVKSQMSLHIQAGDNKSEE